MHRAVAVALLLLLASLAPALARSVGAAPLAPGPCSPPFGKPVGAAPALLVAWQLLCRLVPHNPADH